MEPAWSNIAMQRTVKGHTNYMTRVRTKCKMDGEICNNPKIHTPKITTTKFLFKPYVMLSDTCRSQTLVSD